MPKTIFNELMNGVSSSQKNTNFNDFVTKVDKNSSQLFQYSSQKNKVSPKRNKSCNSSKNVNESEEIDQPYPDINESCQEDIVEFL